MPPSNLSKPDIYQHYEQLWLQLPTSWVFCSNDHKISQNGHIALFSRSLYTITTITQSSHEQTASSISNRINFKLSFYAAILHKQAKSIECSMYQAFITLAYKITVSLPLKFTPGYMSSNHVAWDQSLIAVTANSWTLSNTTNSAIRAYVLTSSSECTSDRLCFLTSLSCADLMLLGYSSFKGSVL